MEKTWNYIHASIFKIFKIVHKYFSNLDPFRLFFKIPSIKKIYERRGIHDPNEILDNIVLNNERTGLFSIWSGIQMGGLLVLLEFGLFNIFQAILGKSLIQYVWQPSNPYKWIFIIALLIIPWIINNRLLWKDDKYLKYFNQFDKESKKVRTTWMLISFAVIMGVLFFFILSFVLIFNVPMDVN